MINHADLGVSPFTRNRQLILLIQAREVTLSGNRKLKIYGQMRCRSGKRMKVQNRVFFTDEAEALAMGYRPCGHCMRNAYRKSLGH